MNIYGDRDPVSYLRAINELKAKVDKQESDFIKTIDSLRVRIQELEKECIMLKKSIISIEGNVIELEEKCK